MRLIEVRDYSAAGWSMPSTAAARVREYCARLEEGNIVYFPRSPFTLEDADRAFLMGIRQAGSGYVKNISYRPGDGRVRGAVGGGDVERLRACLRRYSETIIRVARDVLAPYAAAWQVELASFRTLEEEGRQLPLRARNDLLHIDSFPTRPTNGGRILRVFTNIHPTRQRVWATSDPFHVVASRIAGVAGLTEIAARASSRREGITAALGRFARRLGLPVVYRPPYDRFMLRAHHCLKANAAFQASGRKFVWQFAPDSTWIAFTDTVPHAVLSGQFALEQTFIVPLSALQRPETSPLRVAEGLCGTRLTA